MATRPDLNAAVDFMWRNARLLERHLFACVFLGGAKGPVLHALGAFQNSDGGFGNALEPDMRGTHSQPMHVDMALRVVDEVGAFDHEMVTGALDWLQTVAAPDGGIPWVLPSVADAPHAPWWQPGRQGTGSVGATASILQFALKNRVEHAIVAPGLDFLRTRLTDPMDEDVEFHQLRPAVEVLAYARGAKDAALASRVKDLVERRSLVAPPEKGLNEPYAHTPLHWACEPASPWRAMFTDDELERDLDTLAQRQTDDGSWPLGFPLTSPAAEYEWKGRFTFDALQTLRAYGRLA